MKKKIVFLMALLGMLMQQSVFAQTSSDPPGWKFPQDPEKKKLAKEKNVLYSDYLRNSQYKEAKPPLVWLLKNTPDLNESIYIYGIKIYDELASAATDPQKIQELGDSVILLHDLRIKYFNQKEDVLNRKAFYAYKYWSDREKKYPELYQAMKEAYAATGNDFWIQNTVAFLDAARRHKLKGGAVSDLEFVEHYSDMTTVVDAYEEKKKDSETVGKIKEQLDRILLATIPTDCPSIQNNFGSLLKQQPDNVKLAKVVIKLAFAAKCTNSEVFNKAVKLVQAKEPSVGLARLIAAKAIEAGDFDAAIDAYKNAIDLAEDNMKKGDLYLGLAKIYAKKGAKSTARDYALQAVNTDPSNRDAYDLIGDLYFNSFNDCRGNVSQVKDRAVFIAAYEMYQKAGNQQMMGKAQEQFPSAAMIHEENMSVGAPIQIGCWIGRTVNLQKSPK